MLYKNAKESDHIPIAHRLLDYHEELIVQFDIFFFHYENGYLPLNDRLVMRRINRMIMRK